MTTTKKLLTIVAVKHARTSDPDAPDPVITFEVDDESGESFEVPFTAGSMATATMMAVSWKPFRSGLSKLPELKQGEMKQITCSFCGKDIPEPVKGTPPQVVGGSDLFICRECVSMTVDIMAADPMWRESQIEALSSLRQADDACS